jgi:hypothetical protein
MRALSRERPKTLSEAGGQITFRFGNSSERPIHLADV